MSTERPLSGVKVVDMSTFIAAPGCARILGEFGADVIRVEAKSGDAVRFNGTSEGRPDSPYENTTYDLENSHKRVIAMDLKAPEGKEILFKLLADADVFITNWRPQALKKQALDYESLSKRFPKLVYASFTGYGEEGPDQDLPGYDFTAFFARSGILGSLYQKGTEPMNLIPGMGDHIAGMALCNGIMIALFKAAKTGKGDKVCTNLLHTAIYIQGIMLQAAQYTDMGHSYPISRKEADNPFNNAYKTMDGRFIQLSMPPFDMFYPKFMPLIGREDLVGNERYTMDSITKNHLHTEFISIIDEAFAKKDAEEWDKILREADIPHSVAQTWEEVLVDPQAWAIHALEKVSYPDGDRTLVRPPVVLQNVPLAPYDKAPLLGEHSEEILRDYGYTEEQIKTMHDKGVFVNWEDVKKRCKG